MKVKLKMLALFFSLIDNTEYMSQSNSEQVNTPVAYPEGFSYWYTGMGTQILVPKK